MDNPTPDELNQILEDLSGSFLEGKRKFAAQILGQLPTSSTEIVQALAAAVATDSDPEVRTTAVLALQAPVHQDFIKNNPDLMQQAIESAVRGKQQVQQATDEKIAGEFQRILKLEKRAYLVFFFSLFASLGLFIFLLTLDLEKGTANCFLRIFQVAVIASAVIFSWRSWRKYRCPNCDSWLGGFKAGINVWFASPPLKCPHCGTRLM